MPNPKTPEAIKITENPVAKKELMCIIVGINPELITNPESPLLDNFHKTLVTSLGEDAVEPLETFQTELKKSQDPNSKIHFLCVAQADPEDKNIIFSGAYGSVQISKTQDGLLAFRFSFAELCPGSSQNAEKFLIEQAKKYCEQKGKPLNAFVIEATKDSEKYWNSVEIQKGNSMRRLYLPGTSEEINYCIPPLTWNKDGTPATQAENFHLQIAMLNHKKEIPIEELKNILKDWWQEWYIRPEEDFNNTKAWEQHKKTVNDILENTIFTQFEGHKNLILMSEEERNNKT